MRGALRQLRPLSTAPTLWCTPGVLGGYGGGTAASQNSPGLGGSAIRFLPPYTGYGLVPHRRQRSLSTVGDDFYAVCLDCAGCPH